jgi:HEPN domain-containing protein
MTNWEAGRKFIGEAERILERDAVDAYEKGSWNLSVRRSQEAVELALKGLLRMLGIDYPKHHDVGELFLQQVMDKFPAIKRDILERIKDISKRLSRDRAPAFYFERVYSEDDAQKAVTDARFVLGYVKERSEEFKRGEEVVEEERSEDN